jgi:hypothetical protein
MRRVAASRFAYISEIHRSTLRWGTTTIMTKIFVFVIPTECRDGILG